MNVKNTKSSASMDRDTFYCIERLSYDDDRKSRRSGFIEKAFATDDYTKEDLQYVPDVLRHCSRKTLWRTFDSCNNYKVPEPVPQIDTKLHYWYTKDEEKERKRILNM